jgi:hypothetical protein
MSRQIGCESRVEVIEVANEAMRVLKPAGLMLLDLGDVYGQSGNTIDEIGGSERIAREASPPREHRYGRHKEVLLLPARVAMSLQASGWLLRAEIVWRLAQLKPESVADRPNASTTCSTYSPGHRSGAPAWPPP